MIRPRARRLYKAAVESSRLAWRGPAALLPSPPIAYIYIFGSPQSLTEVLKYPKIPEEDSNMSSFQSLDFTTSYNEQNQSPFFYKLPPEIRHLIYVYALSEYENLERPYNKNTYWWRPGNTAALRSATELLRACRRIYNEAWLLQFALAEHRFYLTHDDRAPHGSCWPPGFREGNQMIYERYGKHQQHGPGERLGLGGIRVFAQLWALEPGDDFQMILDMPHFYPRRIALTIRYSDFWYWESMAPLHIDATWVNHIRFPESVTHFTMDFEMIERRKDEVKLIANEAAKKWFFKRRDNKILTASVDDISESTWTGSSVLGDERWIRDEARPGQLDYLVVTVTWKLQPKASVPKRSCPDLGVPDGYFQPFPPFPPQASIHVDDLRRFNVSLDTRAVDAWSTVQRGYLDEDSDSDSESDDDDDDDSDSDSEDGGDSDDDSRV